MKCKKCRKEIPDGSKSCHLDHNRTFECGLFFGLNAEKRLKIWTSLCFIMICGRRKRYQTESTKINKSTQNLHSKKNKKFQKALDNAT